MTSSEKSFAKLSEVAVGDTIKVDSGFTCIEADTESTVLKSENEELYFDCKDGRHNLIGQTVMNEESDDTLVGIYKIN